VPIGRRDLTSARDLSWAKCDIPGQHHALALRLPCPGLNYSQ
jgi:hypothetical protein